VSGLDEPYVLAVARSGARSLKASLPEKVAVAVHEFVTGTLLENPHRVGNRFDAPLAPAYSARRVSGAVLDRR
jgi:hypothetical protein